MHFKPNFTLQYFLLPNKIKKQKQGPNGSFFSPINSFQYFSVIYYAGFVSTEKEKNKVVFTQVYSKGVMKQSRAKPKQTLLLLHNWVTLNTTTKERRNKLILPSH